MKEFFEKIWNSIVTWFIDARGWASILGVIAVIVLGYIAIAIIMKVFKAIVNKIMDHLKLERFYKIQRPPAFLRVRAVFLTVYYLRKRIPGDLGEISLSFRNGYCKNVLGIKDLDLCNGSFVCLFHFNPPLQSSIVRLEAGAALHQLESLGHAGYNATHNNAHFICHVYRPISVRIHSLN